MEYFTSYAICSISFVNIIWIPNPLTLVWPIPLYVIYFHNPKHKLEANIVLNSNTFHYLKQILSSDANVCCCNCYVILILHGNKRVGVQYKLKFSHYLLYIMVQNEV